MIAVILALLLPKQWEAYTTLRMGRLPLEKDEYKLIEDPAQTVERIKLNEFKEMIISDLNVPTTDKNYNKRTGLITKSLKGSVIPNTDFINLSIRGLNQQDALKALHTTVNEIKAAHAAISNPLKIRVEQELKATTENLASNSIELATLKNKIEPSNVYKTVAGFSQTIVAIKLLTDTEKNHQSLKNQQIISTARLAAFDEQATKQVSAITVSKNPVFPKLNIFLLIGALFGLLTGVLVAIFKYEDPADKKA
ncbi:MAG: hypothetical protein H7Z73_11675 [Candidatus Saccharibacteria bacterium]|nr:hypothetical protein [Moraxellaceae bacterium]